MAQYAFSNQLGGTPQNLSSSYKTICLVTAATGATTLRRGWIFEFEIGADNVPNATDCPINWDISSQTSAGTITAITPNPTDQGGGDAAALLVYGANATAEGGITANSSVFYLGLNQRASQRWIARDEKSAIIVAAVNLKGWAMRAKSPNYASTVGWQAFITE
jgi:hypothetical protein